MIIRIGSLAVMRMVNIASNSITHCAAHQHVTEIVAPKFGRDTNPDAMAAAERRLYELARYAAAAAATIKDRLIEAVLRALGRVPAGAHPSTADSAAGNHFLEISTSKFTPQGGQWYFVALTYDLQLTDDIVFRPLARLPPFAILPRDHALAARATLRLADLAPEPMVLLELPI